jgi:hypothetical protein
MRVGSSMATAAITMPVATMNLGPKRGSRTLVAIWAEPTLSGGQRTIHILWPVVQRAPTERGHIN